MPQSGRLCQSGDHETGRDCANIKEAIAGYIIALEEDGLSIPEGHSGKL